jgi:outer membrane protein assembly factor BamD
MHKPKLFLPLILILLFGLQACHKKGVKLVGNETDEEAIQKCIALSEKKQFTKAVECLEIFKSRYPESHYALEAELSIADNYYQKKEWILAAETYQLYAKLHPSSDKLDYAYYRAGLAYQNQLPKSIDRDLGAINEAENNFAAVFRRFPESPYAELAQAKFNEIRGRSAKKDMYVGRFYYKYGQYRAAIPRFLEVLQDYPTLGFDEDALFHLAFSFYRLGIQDKAVGAAQIMQEKFPNTKKTKKVVQKILGGNNG